MVFKSCKTVMHLARPSFLFRAAHKVPLRDSKSMNAMMNVNALYTAKMESFLCGANANYLEAQYMDWIKSKGSVNSSWDQFYESLNGPSLKIEEFHDDQITIVPSPTTDKSQEKKDGIVEEQLQ